MNRPGVNTADRLAHPDFGSIQRETSLPQPDSLYSKMFEASCYAVKSSNMYILITKGSRKRE
jgi:hypothetical protein